jgi:pyruvate,water dikinase
MELMDPRPYEDPSFPDNLLNDRKDGGLSLWSVLANQEASFKKALAEFKTK